MSSEHTIMVVAGEASADAHAAAMVRELRKLVPDLSVYGVGGKSLEAEGAELFLDFSRVGVVGVSEVLPELGRFYSAYKSLVKSVGERKPAGVLLLDLPDFNLMLAGKIRKRYPGTKIIYYISPQVWGWRPGRVKKIAKRADAMLTLFPFEVEIYEKEGMDVEFVGHPLRETAKAGADRETLRNEFGLSPDSTVVALLPGSRKSEIEMYLPVISSFVLMLKEKKPDTEFLLARAPTIDESIIEEKLGRASAHVKIIEARTYDVLASADLSVVASGTATLETAIIGTPMIVLGAVSTITYYLVKPFALIDLYSLPNIISKREVVPELIQHDITPERLLETAENLLDHPELRQKMKEDLAEVKEALGEEGASARTALAVKNRLWPEGTE